MAPDHRSHQGQHHERLQHELPKEAQKTHQKQDKKAVDKLPKYSIIKHITTGGKNENKDQGQDDTARDTGQHHMGSEKRLHTDG